MLKTFLKYSSKQQRQGSLFGATPVSAGFHGDDFSSDSACAEVGVGSGVFSQRSRFSSGIGTSSSAVHWPSDSTRHATTDRCLRNNTGNSTGNNTAGNNTAFEGSLDDHVAHPPLTDRLLIVAAIGLCFLLYISIIGVLSKAGLPLLVAAALVYCLTLLMLLTSRSSGRIDVVTRDVTGSGMLREADFDGPWCADQFEGDTDQAYGYSRVNHHHHLFRMQ